MQPQLGFEWGGFGDLRSDVDSALDTSPLGGYTSQSPLVSVDTLCCACTSMCQVLTYKRSSCSLDTSASSTAMSTFDEQEILQKLHDINKQQGGGEDISEEAVKTLLLQEDSLTSLNALGDLPLRVNANAILAGQSIRINGPRVVFEGNSGENLTGDSETLVGCWIEFTFISDASLNGTSIGLLAVRPDASQVDPLTLVNQRATIVPPGRFGFLRIDFFLGTQRVGIVSRSCVAARSKLTKPTDITIVPR